jgi:AraC-like DNA-binding protein
MRKNIDTRVRAAEALATRDDKLLAQHMRACLADGLARLAAGTLPIRLPDTDGDWVARGEGHFHLAPELFLQIDGSTTFRFPHGELVLGPGEALVLPTRLLHAEHVAPAADGGAFSNIVIYAEDGTMTCHLAHEREPGRPGILYLEARQHPQAQSIQHWLADAARLGVDRRGPDEEARATMQLRALLMAAAAGVLRALDDPTADERSEPALIARVRVLIKNQLGDAELSVRRLAAQSGCTADYLSHSFSQAVGERLAAHINRLRMERAARLLGESDLSGKEIAWACGFASQGYFIRTFRTHFGMTPNAWREGRTAEA